MTRDGRRPFFVEIIKPSHYDDDGYVIQWLRAFIPSNSLACLYALAHAAGERRVLGEGVDVVVNAYDESNTVIPVRKIIRRIQRRRRRPGVAGRRANQPVPAGRRPGPGVPRGRHLRWPSAAFTSAVAWRCCPTCPPTCGPSRRRALPCLPARPKAAWSSC